MNYIQVSIIALLLLFQPIRNLFSMYPLSLKMRNCVTCAQTATAVAIWFVNGHIVKVVTEYRNCFAYSYLIFYMHMTLE